MKYSLSILALALGAQAASNCTFTLSASGGQTGIVGQLGDGQNRIGGNNTRAVYSINNGQITDSGGRGCILTPPTSQFQCDTGTTPTGGFSIASNGKLTYGGSTQFYACPASTIMYNIYTTPVQGQTKCVRIELTASGCYSTASSSTRPVSSSTRPASSSSRPASTSTVRPVSSSVKPASSSSKPAPPPQTIMTTNTIRPSTSVPTVVCPAPQTVTVTSVVTVTAPAPRVSSASTSRISSASTSRVSSASTSRISSASTSRVSSASTSRVSSTSTPKVSSTSAPQRSSTPAPAPSNSTRPAPAPSGVGKTCPTNLSGSYQYPHLIIPVSSSNPNKAYGTSYNGTITPDTSSIFNFDIPSSYTGTCSLIFLLPEQKNLQTSSFTLYGNGMLDFKMLNNVATQSTTYNNQGSVKATFARQTIKPGFSAVITTFPCPAGSAVSYEISSVNGTSLRYFQDYNPSPIGLYITTC